MSNTNTGYGFEHNGTVFTPDGAATPATPGLVEAQNLKVEAKEIAWFKTAPDKLFLYVYADKRYDHYLATWLGTKVSETCEVGRSVPVGGIAGWWSKKRSVDCRIFGVRYVGWYYETAGDYCRLRKAKRQ